MVRIARHIEERRGLAGQLPIGPLNRSWHVAGGEGLVRGFWVRRISFLRPLHDGLRRAVRAGVSWTRVNLRI